MNFRDLVCAGVGAETPKAVLPLPGLHSRLPSAQEEYLSSCHSQARKAAAAEGSVLHPAWLETDYTCILTSGGSQTLAAPLFFQSPKRAPNKFRGDELIPSIDYLSGTVLGSLSLLFFCFTPDL